MKLLKSIVFFVTKVLYCKLRIIIDLFVIACIIICKLRLSDARDDDLAAFCLD